MSNTLPPTFRPIHGVVCALLTQSNRLDAHEDQPYMPWENTTLTEAVRHLRYHGRLLIQGGEMYYGTAGLAKLGLFVRMWGRMDIPAITWFECLRLLKTNYTNPQRPYPHAHWVAKQKEFLHLQAAFNDIPEDERITIPSPPPSDMPVDDDGGADVEA